MTENSCVERNKGSSLTHRLLPCNQLQQKRGKRKKYRCRKKKQQVSPSGGSTKSALIHLSAAVGGKGGKAVISKKLRDDLLSLGEWSHSAGV